MRLSRSTQILGVAGVLAVVLAFVLLSLGSRTQVPTRDVVVARAAIPAGGVVTEGMVTVRPVPEGAVPEGALGDVRAAVGKRAAAAISPGQVLTPGLLTEAPSGNALAPSVPGGLVAYALPATDLLSANGALAPGDRVDVIATIRPGGDQGQPTTQLLYQDVTVLTSLSAQGGTPAVVLALEPQQAVEMTLVRDSGGSFTLVLRSPKDAGQQHAAEGATLDSVATDHGFRVPQEVEHAQP